MDLRLATSDDLPDIARLHEVNWRRDYADILPAVALGTALGADMADLWDSEALKTRRVIVAREGQKLLGFASMMDEGPDGCAFLDSLHVAPTARAQGVGRALMAAVAVLAIPGALTLEVLSANTTARAICRSWGGQETPEYDDEILGYTVPTITVGWRDAVQLVDRLSGHTP